MLELQEVTSARSIAPQVVQEEKNENSAGLPSSFYRLFLWFHKSRSSKRAMHIIKKNSIIHFDRCFFTAAFLCAPTNFVFSTLIRSIFRTCACDICDLDVIKPFFFFPGTINFKLYSLRPKFSSFCWLYSVIQQKNYL